MKKILLAYDGGEPARRALETAGQLTRAFHASLSVVSVVPEVAGRPPRDPSNEACLHARELQEAKRLLAEMGLEVELLEPSGDPARRIEQIAEEGGFDTIVLGCGGDHQPDGARRGRVSGHVVTHAAATVVVAR
jgi:nucleotide-binding universal stress UspA family protein